jgi:hypothetical protein
MFALLQIIPLEALDGDERGVDVIAVDVSRERLQQFAADYQQRYRTALKELDAWDECSERSTEAYVAKAEELSDTHSVMGGLFLETRWDIVEIWDGQRDPADEQTPEEKIAA